MIPVGVDIYLGTQPVDLRWGFDRLCGVITERVGRRPRSGAIFVFFGKRRHAMKVFYFDGTGGSDLPEARRNDRGSRGRVRTETSAPAVG